MSERAAKSQRLWSVPVALSDVPESGLHIDLTADPATRAAIAALAGVNALKRLDAAFDLTRHGRGGLHVSGTVRGTVAQTCVVTLDPLDNDIDETVDLTFVPPGGAAAPASDAVEETVLYPDDADPPEELVNGVVDLGRIATEFLVLGVDPYPRKPDAVFTSPSAADSPDSPFAALAALKKDETGRG